MVDSNTRIGGDASELLRALDQAQAAWDRYTQEILEADDATVKLNAKGKLTQAVLRNTAAEGVKLTTTLEKLKNGTVRQTESIRDQTNEINKRSAARAEELRLIQLQAAATERANRRRGQNVVRGVRGSLTEAAVSDAQASPAEVINLRRQEGILAELTAKTKLTSREILAIWRNVARDQAQAFVGSRRVIQEQLQRVLQAQRALGTEAKKTAVAQEESARRARAAYQKQQLAAENATKSAREFTLSWRSLLRILSIQVVSRGFFTLVSQLQEATRTATEFQIAVARTQTIDRANTSFSTLADNLERVSNRFGIDIIDQATGAYFTLSNQVAEGTEAIRFLEEANKFALAAFTTTEDAVNLLTAAINAFGLSIEDTNRISSIFFNTIEEGRVTADELANTFGRVAVPAQQLNVSLDEVAALLSTMTINGVKANEAMTFIRNIFLKLIRPGDQMKELFREIGAESGEAALQTQTLFGFFKILEERTKGSSTEIGNFFQRIRAISGAMLTSGDNLQRFNEILQQSAGASESFQRAQDVVLDSTGKRFEIALNEIQNFFTRDLGESVLEGLSDVTDGFRLLPPLIAELVNQIKLLGAAFVLALGARPMASVILGLVRLRTTILAVEASSQSMRKSLVLSQIAFNNLKASLVNFARNNPFTAILITATVLVEIFDRISGRAERIRRELEEAATKALELAEKANAQQTASLNEQLTIFKAAQRERVRVSLIASDTIIGDLNKLVDEYEDAEDKIAKSAKDANKEVAKLLGAQLKDTEKQIKESADNIIKIQDSLKKAASDAQKQILGIDLGEAAGGTEQIKILDQFINRLREERGKLNLVDPEGFAALSQQIQELQTRRDQIAINAQEEIRSAENELTELQKERLKLILDFQKTRRSGGADRSTVLGFAQALGELNEAEEELTRLIENERGAASEVEGIRDRITERMREQQSLLKESLKFEKEKSIELAKQAARQIEAQAALKSVTERVSAFDFADVREAVEGGRPQDAIDQISEQNRLLQEQSDIRRRLGIHTAASVESTTNQAETNQARLRALLEKQRVVNAKKIATDEQATLNKRLAVLQRAERQAREQVSGLDLQIETFIKRLSSLVSSGQLSPGRQPLASQAVLAGGALSGVRGESDTRKQNAEASEALLKTLDDLLTGNGTPDETVAAIRQLGRLIVVDQQVDREDRAEGVNEFVDQIDNLVKGLQESIRDDGVGARRTAAFEATEQLKAIIAETRRIQEESGVEPDEALTAIQLFAKAQTDIAESQQNLIDALNTLNDTVRTTGQGFADGGTVPGGFGGGDRVHALLESGEEVINKDSARAFRSQLKAINSGSMPRFQAGGTVTSMGDFNVSLQATGNTEVDVEAIGRALETKVRRGQIDLTPRRRF